MSEFKGDVYVQNKNLGNLPVDTAEIKQSSYEILEESVVQLAFDTNNPLPSKATIVVAVPQTLPKLFADVNTCYMKVNGLKLENVCIFNDYDITFVGAFEKYSEAYTGRIQLFFKVQNPKDN